MFLPKHTKVISLVRADDLRNINCQCVLADACACCMRIAMCQTRFLPIVGRYYVDSSLFPYQMNFLGSPARM